MDDICKVCGNDIADFHCFPKCGKAEWDEKIAAFKESKKGEKK